MCIYIYIYEKTKQKHVNVVSRKVRYFSSPRFLYFFVNLRASLPLQPMKIGCQVTFVRILFLIRVTWFFLIMKSMPWRKI